MRGWMRVWGAARGRGASGACGRGCGVCWVLRGRTGASLWVCTLRGWRGCVSGELGTTRGDRVDGGRGVSRVEAWQSTAVAKEKRERREMHNCGQHNSGHNSGQHNCAKHTTVENTLVTGLPSSWPRGADLLWRCPLGPLLTRLPFPTLFSTVARGDHRVVSAGQRRLTQTADTPESTPDTCECALHWHGHTRTHSRTSHTPPRSRAHLPTHTF
ncbi:hypothetical protein K439DRAFT_1618338 [Ramaria rubella]|nr:hypothetical protein K439DRAFT_1618338 [Ramaria rubella]